MFYKASSQDSYFYDEYCKGKWILFGFQCPIDFGWDFLAPIDGIVQRIRELGGDRSIDLIRFGAFLQQITTSGDASGDFTEYPRAIALPTANNEIEFIGLVWKEDGGNTFVALKIKYADLPGTMLQGETPLGTFTEITV
ncbi:MAG: hypothetical protein DWQ28_09155 [Proteobacteria bacterium]|nr:MAG: hypothetical protein DWQ28_09155 [Pseudomonadota bacterium]